jgi:hypothetical protein
LGGFFWQLVARPKRSYPFKGFEYINIKAYKGLGSFLNRGNLLYIQEKVIVKNTITCAYFINLPNLRLTASSPVITYLQSSSDSEIVFENKSYI